MEGGQRGYSKRRTWRKVHLALNANTGQVHAVLMTHQNVPDGDARAKLLDQIPRAKNKSMSSAVPTTPSHAMRPLLHAVLFLRFCHARVPSLASGYARCGVAMARLMQLPVTVVENGSKTVVTIGNRLPRMRCIGSRPSPATVSGRVTSRRRRPRSPFASASSTVWRTSLVRNPFVSSEIMPVDAMASSHSIYATTPFISRNLYII
ncbi:MAG: transposase [Burkholderia sp.]